MSKKFKKPFKAYELTRVSPVDVELAPKLKEHLHLADNPLYYFNAFQFMKGGFYRALLGYEALWDEKVEERLQLSLDYFLHKLETRCLYYLEEVSVELPWKVYGQAWVDRLKPESLDLKHSFCYQLKQFESMTVRVNLIDRPYAVDLERDTGEIFTVSFKTYIRLLAKKILKRKVKELNDDPFRTPATKNQSPSMVNFLKGILPHHRPLPPRLFSVSARRRGKDPL